MIDLLNVTANTSAYSTGFCLPSASFGGENTFSLSLPWAVLLAGGLVCLGLVIAATSYIEFRKEVLEETRKGQVKKTGVEPR